MIQPATAPTPRTWDGRLARWLVTPLRDTWVTPNHLTTVRLSIGVVGAVCLAHGGDAWANAGMVSIALSNFVDHTDGELARISGKTSRFGHHYDLACDALVTVLLFACLGLGLAAEGRVMALSLPLPWLGLVAGIAVALIFFLRMRIEAVAGKAGTTQSFAAGFETEDVLYLLPLVTLCGVSVPFLVVAAIGAPLFALWVAFDHRQVMQRVRPDSALGSTSR